MKYRDASRVNALFAGTPHTVRIIDAETLHLHYPPAVTTPGKMAEFLKATLSPPPRDA